MQNDQPHIANSLLNSFKAFVGSHFLLNIINAIQSDVILNKNKSAFDVLQKYSRLYKSALRSSNEQFVSVSSEIDLLNEYIALEQLRFPTKTFPKIVSKSIDETSYVPSFIFQSLVENAWLLSLEHSNSKLGIEIKTTEKSVKLIINLKPESQKIMHSKVEGKTQLAIERLELLKKHDTIDYTINWNNNHFLELTIHLNK